MFVSPQKRGKMHMRLILVVTSGMGTGILEESKGRIFPS